jgi:hypothetical protein
VANLDVDCRVLQILEFENFEMDLDGHERILLQLRKSLRYVRNHLQVETLVRRMFAIRDIPGLQMKSYRKLYPNPKTSVGSSLESSRIKRKIKAAARIKEMFEKAKGYLFIAASRCELANKLGLGIQAMSRYMTEWQLRGWIQKIPSSYLWTLKLEGDK